MWKNIDSCVKADGLNYVGQNISDLFSYEMIILMLLINEYKPDWLLLTVMSHRVM